MHFRHLSLSSVIFSIFFFGYATGVYHSDLDLDPAGNLTLSGSEVHISSSNGTIFPRLFGQEVTHIVISGNDIVEVEDEAFCGTGERTSIIIGANVHFPNITNAMFEKCRNLQELRLENVIITDWSIFRNHVQLSSVRLFNVTFANADVIPDKLFKDLRLDLLLLKNIVPRTFGDEVFTSLKSIYQLVILSDNVDDSHEFSKRTFRNLPNICTKVELINMNLTSVKWSRMDLLHQLVISGPLYDTHEARKKFLNKLYQYFPNLAYLRLEAEYFTESERTFVESKINEDETLLSWSKPAI